MTQARLDIFGRPQDRRAGRLLGPRGRQVLTVVLIVAASLTIALATSDPGEGPVPQSEIRAAR